MCIGNFNPKIGNTTHILAFGRIVLMTQRTHNMIMVVNVQSLRKENTTRFDGSHLTTKQGTESTTV